MNISYEKKAMYRDRENIFQFVKTFGIGQGKTFFFTLTFSDNVTDRKIAGHYWNLMNTKIKQKWKDFKYILVAERQKRGAWHFHVLGYISGLPSLNVFLKYIRSYISRSSKPFGFCKCIWTYGKSYKAVAAYMVKYMQKQIREKGVRLVGYSQNWMRAVVMPFAWVYGAAARWRQSCNILNNTFPGLFRYLYNNGSYRFKTQIVDYQQSGSFESAFSLIIQSARKVFPSLADHVAEVLIFFKVKNFLDSSSDFSNLEKEFYQLKKDFFDYGKYLNDIPGAQT